MLWYHNIMTNIIGNADDSKNVIGFLSARILLLFIEVWHRNTAFVIQDHLRTFWCWRISIVIFGYRLFVHRHEIVITKWNDLHSYVTFTILCCNIDYYRYSCIHPYVILILFLHRLLVLLSTVAWLNSTVIFWWVGNKFWA